MKKFLSLLMALTMLMACTACFGSAESASDPAAYDGSEVNITFYNTMGSNLTPVLDTYIEEFNKLYPNIHVSYTSVGGYDDVRDQISKEITVGGQPNIAYCYPDHVALYNLARAVQPLDAYIDSTATVTRADGTTETFGLTQEQKDDFISAYYEEGRQFGDGKMYTLPMSKSTEVLYYNKTFFDANGLTPPTTWDEMEALCNKIVEIDPYSIPLGYDSENNWFITMTEQLKTPLHQRHRRTLPVQHARKPRVREAFRNVVQSGACDDPDHLRQLHLRSVRLRLRHQELHVHRFFRRRDASASDQGCGRHLSL